MWIWVSCVSGHGDGGCGCIERFKEIVSFGNMRTRVNRRKRWICR
jgi:hypothetical protein